MKILIVDDNTAIQEILSEILSVDGYETRTASSIDDAVTEMERFKPDATLLDSTVGEEDGLVLLDRMISKGNHISNVLLLTANSEHVPKDELSIAGFIQKPFKSTEVLEKVRSLFSEQVIREKPKRSILRSIFGKKDIKENQNDIDLRFGTSYMFIESDKENAYHAVSFFLDEGCDVMVITSGRIKAAMGKVDDECVNDNMKIIALSNKEGPDYIEPEHIGTLMNSITEFAEEKERPAVIIDDLDMLIDRNDLNSVITMIHQTINGGSGKRLTLIASAESDEMTEKDRELLMSCMEIRVFE